MRAHDGPSPDAAVPRTFSRGAGLLSAVLLTALLLAGCSGQEASGTPAARVTTWVQGAGGGAAIGTVEVDSRNIDQALAHHDRPAAIRSVCALLTNDAETAIGNLPTPDTTLTDALNAAFEEAAAAGDDCYQGAAGDARLLRRSASERVRLLPMLEAAVERITAVTGHTPTTETTAPQSGSEDPFGGS